MQTDGSDCQFIIIIVSKILKSQKKSYASEGAHEDIFGRKMT